MNRTALAWSVTLMAAAFATALAWGHQPLSVALMAAALITPTYLDQKESTTMISADDVMKKIQHNDDWVTVYGTGDNYDLGVISYYAESDDELAITLSYLGDAADLALKALRETSRIGGARVVDVYQVWTNGGDADFDVTVEADTQGMPS